MATPSVHVGTRKVLLAGAVTCAHDDTVTVQIDESTFRISFATSPGGAPGFAVTPKGKTSEVVVTNADSATGSSFIAQVGRLGAKDFMLSLFVLPGTGQGNRFVAYTFSA